MAGSDASELNRTVDHLFRTEAGKMVSVLTHLFGFANIEQAEDIVHDTILKALETWRFGRIPENPQAWLYRVAKNKAIDLIRREKLKYKIETELSILLKSEYTLAPTINELFTEGEIKDSQLRMMFASCHPVLSEEAQITLVLKTLCGLSVHEIAGAFLTSEETIAKRLYRTREKVRNEKISLDYPGAEMMERRLEAVLKTLYLLFNEGYSSSHPEKLIREDLCEEAMRLTILLTENAKTEKPQTYALIAMMCFHASRFNTRLDDKGLIVLLKDQDRSQWSQFLIAKGNDYLNKAAEGKMIHDFHIEAAIASVHANASSYEKTDWQLILNLYNLLYERTHNPIVALNRAVVLGEVQGYDKAVTELNAMRGMEKNCHYHTSLGEMYFKAGQKEKAEKTFLIALDMTTSKAEKDLIHRKIGECFE